MDRLEIGEGAGRKRGQGAYFVQPCLGELPGWKRGTDDKMLQRIEHRVWPSHKVDRVRTDNREYRAECKGWQFGRSAV